MYKINDCFIRIDNVLVFKQNNYEEGTVQQESWQGKNIYLMRGSLVHGYIQRL